MKDKILKILGKKKPNNISQGYYDGPADNNPMSTDDEIKSLKKENEKLKAQLKNKALDKFNSRRSIRKFSTEPIDYEIVYNIVDAALNAPAAGGVENTKVIIVEDRKAKNEIGKIENQQYWLSDAPYLLVVVRENHRLMDLYPGDGELYAVQNTAAVIQNILMLVHFYDLGACWVESCDSEVIKEFLKVPGDKFVDAVIPIGFPLENPKVAKAPLQLKMFFEKYGNKRQKQHH